MDATNPIQLQDILLLPDSVWLRNVVIDTQPTSYPFSRAGTVLYVTIVNVILAMRINALYRGHRYCGVFLVLLVVGELHLCETSRLFQPTPQENFWFVASSVPDIAHHAFHLVTGRVFDMRRNSRTCHSYYSEPSPLDPMAGVYDEFTYYTCSYPRELVS